MASLNRTLVDIRSDIQTRLGFGMAGQAGVVNSPLIDSFIRSAQIQLYHQFEWAELQRVYERLTGTDQQYYDYPDDCDLEQISLIAVKWGGSYHKLTEGITLGDRGVHPGGVPQKYERRDQLELWPVPSSNDYTLRFEYTKALDPLVDSGDRTTIDSEIVFLHALTNAKSHYRQPDAETYATQLEAILNRLKAKNRGQSVWNKKGAKIDPYSYIEST